MKIYYFFCWLSIVFFIPTTVGATSVSPAIIDLELDPGQSITQEIILYNETDEDIFINGSIEQFKPKGEVGEAEILPFNVTDTSVNWIKLPNNSLVLKPGEEVAVPVIVNVPITADVGGYYLALMWESSSGPESNKSHQTLISSRVGVLILLTVNGEINSNLEINNFELTKNKNFYSNTDINFLLRLRNTGSIHVRPQGSVVIKNFVGKTVEILSINNEQGAILPNTNRIFNISWIDNDVKFKIISNFINQLTDFSFGKFSAKAIVDYGNDQSVESEVVYFWMIPWPLILFVIAIIALIIGFFRNIKNKKIK